MFEKNVSIHHNFKILGRSTLATSDSQQQITIQEPLIRPTGNFSPDPGRRKNVEVIWRSDLSVGQFDGPLAPGEFGFITCRMDNS